jgi:hypothetical protein
MAGQVAGGRNALPPARRGLWVCPRCHLGVEFYVGMTAPPVCNAHIGGKPAVMEWKRKV